MPLEIIVTIVLFALFCAAVPAVLQHIGNRRAGGWLALWARESGHTLIEATLVPAKRGPFAMRGYWTSVFRIRARRADGVETCAWACTGNFFLWGFGEVEVVWDAT